MMIHEMDKMFKGHFFSTLFLLLIFFAAGCAESANTENRSIETPNIIYILADDLGYGELGVYGQEKIETPNIDALANSGMRFTDHYSGSPVCAPARYMLMTGKHPGNAYIRANDEWGQRGDVWDFEAVTANPALEGQRPIPESTITIGKVLQEAGYKTGAIGKWGLGAPFTEGEPMNQGFDFFYGYNGQRQAHTYYPVYMWRNDKRVALNNQLVDPHQDLPEDADPYDPESYAIFHDQPDYSAELMGIEMLRFIEENQNNPFFLYYPTTIPHAAVQAPQRWIDYYREKFGDEEPYTTGTYVPVRYPRATYAAMISYLDEQIGEMVDKLRELDLYDNTLIMLSSDNGPQHCCGVDPEYFDSAAPFQTASGRVKGMVYEGGIRVPMIAAWEGVIPAGSTSGHISAFWDIMPTLADIAGVPAPDGIDGISFLPVLKGEEDQQEQREFLYWEYPRSGGQQAVRMGKWKGIRSAIISEGSLEIELYNLEEDIREENNIADQHPDVVAQIERIMAEERTVPELPGHRMEALGD
jgi:arylsulfatase A-like enzyme